MKQDTPRYAGVLKRIFAAIKTEDTDREADDGQDIQDVYESVTKLNELVAEMSRLRNLRDSEAGRQTALDAELAEIEVQRFEALTEFRVSADQEAEKQADLLLKKSETISQQKKDCQSIANNIQARIDSMESAKLELVRDYRRDLGRFLNQVFARACKHYSSVAPAAAEAALQMAAVQNVMMLYLAGNSNGFNRQQVYLPTVDPGNGAHLEPLINGVSPAFVANANARTEAIIAELNQAGFVHNFK